LFDLRGELDEKERVSVVEERVLLFERGDGIEKGELFLLLVEWVGREGESMHVIVNEVRVESLSSIEEEGVIKEGG
jgi:hypothetical protein